MKLYTNALSPSARRVTMFLAEKDIHVPTVEIDLLTGEQLSEAYRTINPRCMVPCLELDTGERLTESIAICRYFEFLHPQPPLFGTTADDVGRIEMWSRISEINGLLSVADFLRNSEPVFAERALPGPVAYDQIPNLAVRAKQRYEHFVGMLDARLAESEYLAGNSFSNADITAYVTVEAGNAFNLPLDSGATHIRRWHRQVAARPSAT